jgi:hypothetical protein
MTVKPIFSEIEGLPQGFRGIPGVPDGWELLAIRRAEIGEYVIDGYGKPSRIMSMTSEIFAIVRKIEAPKKYRHFAGAAEAEPFFDERLRKKDVNDVTVHSRFRIGSIYTDGMVIGAVCYSYEEAFETFVKSDGTPFGIAVKDE